MNLGITQKENLMVFGTLEHKKRVGTLDVNSKNKKPLKDGIFIFQKYHFVMVC